MSREKSGLLDNPRDAVEGGAYMWNVNLSSYIYERGLCAVGSSQILQEVHKSISHALPVAQGFNFALSSSVVRPGI
jgi:hypothetical protein